MEGSYARRSEHIAHMVKFRDKNGNSRVIFAPETETERADFIDDGEHLSAGYKEVESGGLF